MSVQARSTHVGWVERKRYPTDKPYSGVTLREGYAYVPRVQPTLVDRLPVSMAIGDDTLG